MKSKMCWWKKALLMTAMLILLVIIIVIVMFWRGIRPGNQCGGSGRTVFQI